MAAENLGRVLPGEVPVTLVQEITLAVERGEFVVIQRFWLLNYGSLMVY